MTIMLWTLRFGVSLGILGLNLWVLPMALAKQAAVYSEPKSDTTPVKVVPPTTTIHGQDAQMGGQSAPDTDTIVNPPPPTVHGQDVQGVQEIDTSTGPHGQDLQVALPTTLPPTDTDTGFVPPTPVSEDDASGVHGQDLEPVSGDTDSTDSKDEILEPASIATIDDDKDGFTEETGDCDDANVTVYPGAVELCDGIDNDCNTATAIDDNCIAADQDSDGDGAIAAVDCNDHDATMKPGGFEECDNKDNDCNGQIDDQCANVYPQDPALSDDSDGDGFTELAGDTNDTDASVYPGAPELDDDKDNDLDGTVDEDFSDDDGDGVTEAAGDPNDADPTVTQAADATETATSSSGSTETGTTPPPSEDADSPATEPEDGTDEVIVVDDPTEEDTASADSDGDGGCSLVQFAVQSSQSNPALLQTTVGTSSSTSASKKKAEDDPVAVQEVEEENEATTDGSTTAQPATDAPATDGGGSTPTATGAPATDGFSQTSSGGHSEQLEGTTVAPMDSMTEPVSTSGTSTSIPLQEIDASVSHNQQVEGVSATTIDDDGDSFTEDAGDCDDANAAIHPGATEVCDSIDNDCNTAIDDNCVTEPSTTVTEPSTTVTEPSTTTSADESGVAAAEAGSQEVSTPPPSEDANPPITEPVEEDIPDEGDVPDETASADSDEDGGCSLTPF